MYIICALRLKIRIYETIDCQVPNFFGDEYQFVLCWFCASAFPRCGRSLAVASELDALALPPALITYHITDDDRPLLHDAGAPHWSLVMCTVFFESSVI